MKLLTLDPCADGLRPHACLRHIPEWPDNGPRQTALRREMEASGLCQPIQITEKHEIVDPDSRERWRAARSLQLPGIPVAIVPQEQVSTAYLNALVQRRHLTKSAIAYLAFPQLQNALDEARDRRFKMLEKANDSRSELSSLPKNIEELAEAIGINRHFIFDAKKVHALFAKDPAFKAQMEPRLLAEPIGGEHEQNRPIGLGAVIAGFEGKKLEDQPRPDRQLDLFVGAHLRSLSSRLCQIQNLPLFRKGIGTFLDSVQDDEQIERLQEIGEAIAAEARARLKKLSARSQSDEANYNRD